MIRTGDSMMTDDDIFADGIDGIHGLRRRERTRLWFRALLQVNDIPDHLRSAIELAPHLAVTAPDLVEAVRIHAVRPGDDHYTDLLVGEFTSDVVLDLRPEMSTEERESRIRRRLGAEVDAAPVAAEPPAQDVREPLTDWRQVPRNAPTLLLSATELLDGRRPGPILGPGYQYRVFSAAEASPGSKSCRTMVRQLMATATRSI